jgi:hypothetical protein
MFFMGQYDSPFVRGVAIALRLYASFIELKRTAVHADFVRELYKVFFRFLFIPTWRKDYVS